MSPKSPSPTSAKISLGKRGEEIAARILTSKGYEIEALNWRSGRLGEIDIIARNPARNLLLFVEVKTRRGDAFGAPQEALGTAKRDRMIALAEIYLQRHAPNANVQVRFDVIAVDFARKNAAAEIEHIEDAFGLA